MTTISVLDLILLVAAVWRLSNLVANEDGPYLIFRKLRRQFEKWDAKYRWFRRAYWKEGIHCEYCNSIWFGTLMTFVYGFVHPGSVLGLGWFVLPLTLSAGAIFIKHLVFVLKSIDTRFDQQNQAHVKEQETVTTWQVAEPHSFAGAIARHDQIRKE